MKLSALVMAGGVGTRLKADTEKPLLELDDRPMIDHVLKAVRGCGYIDRFWAVTSQSTRMTEEYLRGRSVQILRTPGNGYVKDLVFAIKGLGLKKTLVVSADLPLLTSGDLDWVIEEYLKQGLPALAVMIPVNIVEKSGISKDTIIDGYVPSGVNIIDGKNLNGGEFKLVTEELRFSMNVNTISDFKLALRRIKHAC